MGLRLHPGRSVPHPHRAQRWARAQVSTFGKGLLESAAETRMRYVDALCTAKAHSGEHNNIQARYFFRTYDVCASCGHVKRA